MAARQFSRISGISLLYADLDPEIRWDSWYVTLRHAAFFTGIQEGKMSDTEALSQIAAILAKGFLRYRKCRRLRAQELPQPQLDSPPEPSRHVSVVYEPRTDEN